MSARNLVGFDGDLLRRRGAAAGVLAGVVALAVLVIVGALAAAGQIALARRFDPDVAALIVAGVAAGVAVMAAIGFALVLRRTRRDVEKAVRASAVATLAPPALSLALRHKTLAGVAIAAGVGFWLARRRS